MNRRLAIQHVHLHWDKAGRGAYWGAVRNALPREFPFRAPFDSEPGWFHRIAMLARNDYRQDEALNAIAKIDSWRIPVTTRIDGDHLRIKIGVTTRWPLRPHLDGWIARLPFGQRITIRVNAKADGDHERWYFEDTLHIGWAEEATLDLPLFREIDERVLLY